MGNIQNKSNDYWRKRLTPRQYHVLREKGTEPPWSGKFNMSNEKGIYTCAACGQELFSSDAQYESVAPGLQGWPAFSDVLAKGTVTLQEDNSSGMQRIEVVCANCNSHLGHLFEDPTPHNKTRQHYCINSCGLEFKKTD